MSWVVSRAEARVSASRGQGVRQLPLLQAVRPEYQYAREQHQQRAAQGEKAQKDFLAHLILHTIAHAAHGLQQRRARTQLLAQGTHMHVHRAGIPGEVDAPHRIQQLFPGHDQAAVAHERLQQVKLLAGERDVLPVHGDLAAAGIQGDIGGGEHVGGFLLGGAAQHGLHPAEQLHDPEGA